MTQLFYNNIDITNKIDIKKCVLHDYAGNGADDAEIVFPDSEKLWGKWNPQRGDSIVIKSESYSTGLMYLDSIVKSAGIFTLKAISTPISAKKTKNRIWRNIKFSEIISDIAKNNSLEFETYGITEYTYSALSQCGQTDIGFLNDICIREGYCCKVTNGKLIVFSEAYMESQLSKITITSDDLYPEYDFQLSDDVFQNFTVLYYGSELITYTANDNTIVGGSDRRIEYLTNVGEAERWSKGYLRNKNKYRKTAWLPIKYLADVAAASVITIDGFSNFDGKYYIYKITHDTVNNRSYLLVRQTIEKY